MKQFFLKCLSALIILTSFTMVYGQKKITLDDIWVNGTFRQKSLYGVNSMNDGIHYTTLEKNGEFQEINQYEYTTGKKTATLLNSRDLIPGGADKPPRINAYSFSPDERQFLIKTDRERIYRHSTKEKAFVMNRATKKITPIAKGKKHMYASFSPDGKKIAYVRENNLFIMDLSSGEETQVSNDGRKNEIINGASDWVYEEELVLVKAYEWSPDNQRIAYYKFDEKAVREFNMAIYNDLYPSEYRFKYPKAGEENAKVSIHVYDLGSGRTDKIKVPKAEYIPRIQWTQDPHLLAVMTSNRHQNEMVIHVADVTKGTIKTVFTDKSETYIEIHDNLTFLSNNDFVWMSERSGQNHLYRISIQSDKIEPLTSGNFEVTEYIGMDEKRGRLYYMAANSDEPINRYLYSYDVKKKKSSKLSLKEGINRTNFSKNLRYFINYHTTANQPLRITINDPLNGKEVRVIQENEELASTVKDYGFTPVEFFSFKTERNDQLNGWMIKPANFDSKKKYPVLMYVYGGPGSQTVRNTWGGSNFAWYQMLAQKGYIIVSIDNRGTGARGTKFRTCTYKQLGKLETEDQISGAKYLGTLPYVDKDRIGIWGWSYGGYMTTLCMTKGADYFKTGIAVAPVSNWRYYDTIYTERYMQTPQENGDGYDNNSPINHVDKLKGNYLLVHGTADDNVHFQNTTELIQALVKAGKDFDLAIYPDKNHGIGGGKTRKHLYDKMTRFLEENL